MLKNKYIEEEIWRLKNKDIEPEIKEDVYRHIIGVPIS